MTFFKNRAAKALTTAAALNAAMTRRKKNRADAAKNRRLDEFLRALRIEGEKRDKIVAFVEELTFKRLKQLSTGIKEEDGEKKRLPKLRLRMPWMK